MRHSDDFSHPADEGLSSSVPVQRRHWAYERRWTKHASRLRPRLLQAFQCRNALNYRAGFVGD